MTATSHRHLPRLQPRAGSSWLSPDVIQTWQQLHFKGAVADLPATRARRAGGTRTRTRTPADPHRSHPRRPRGTRPARARRRRGTRGSARARAPEVWPPRQSPPNRPAGRQKPPSPAGRVLPHPRTAAPPAGAFPRRAGEPRRPQHMRALCFPRSRALPTCRAGGTPAAPPLPPRRADPAGENLLSETHADGDGSDFSAALRCESGEAPSPPAAPSPRRHRRAPGRWQGTRRGGEGPHAATRATGSTCHASPHRTRFPRLGARRPRPHRKYRR